MKAAVVREFGAPLAVEDLTLDRPQQSEVRVQVAAVAVCGSDVHAASGAWGGSLPAVNGHEAAGVVSEVGDGVDTVGPGDHVVLSILRFCGRCFYCSRGQSHLCDTQFALDRDTRLHDADGAPVVQGIRVGAFAEEVVVHESQVVPVPPELPLTRACLLACGVVTGYGAVVNTAAATRGSSVVVIGTGGVGINCVQAARAVGAHPIIAIDLDDAKLAVALELGATDGLRADDPDLGAEVRARTAGRGADHVFVAAGSATAVERGLDLVRPGGVLVVAGMTAAGEHARIELSEFAAGARQVIGSRMGSMVAHRDIPRLAQHYLDGHLELDALVSSRFTLDDINPAVASATSGEALRNVIVFDGVTS